MDDRPDHGDGFTDDLVYEPNPKHKPGLSPRGDGSRCPPDADGPALLKASDLYDACRYATDGEDAFCARQHRPGRWHGYPALWDEVPPKVVAGWVAAGKVTRSAIRKAKRRQK